ncbi:MAG TPA: PaaX family transcriptional regulator C-terminal domain-containing protein [Streptosporangiaceae bacterium]|jgi:phenylacetic acid degradation operon negative regulatory protein
MALPEPDPRRELGAAGARSLLLTVLGEFALPAGRPVWTAAFLRALGLLGVEEKAIRQALARAASEGWITGERHGRRTAWLLTDAGRRLLTDGTARIYGFGAPVTGWDGRWLLVLASVPESSRALRHLLRTRLAWNGLGNLSPGVWVSPHPEREPEVRAVLHEIGITATVVTGALGGVRPDGPPGAAAADLDAARRVAREAWDLGAVEDAYAGFVAAVGRLHPRGDAATFAAHTRLVQQWRRFPFLDPALPPHLLPSGWSGAPAYAVFHARHDAWRPAADRHWRAMAED